MSLSPFFLVAFRCRWQPITELQGFARELTSRGARKKNDNGAVVAARMRNRQSLTIRPLTKEERAPLPLPTATPNDDVVSFSTHETGRGDYRSRNECERETKQDKTERQHRAPRRGVRAGGLTYI